MRVEGRRAGQVPPLIGLRARSKILSDQPPSLGRARCGLTLIELLVVIIILTTLVSAAIPLLSPTNDDRRLREASRGVNSFISGAQMKAVQTQRPFGVAIKRLSKDTNSNTATNDVHEDNAVSIELNYVEQPAPYRGYDRTSSAMVARHPTRSGWVLIQFVARGNSFQQSMDQLSEGWDADLFPPNLIRPGDVIEVDGTRYLLLNPFSPSPTGWARVDLNNQGAYDASGSGAVRIEARPLNDTGQMLNVEYDDRGNRMRDLPTGSTPIAPFWTNPSPYKILRQPTPTSDEPFQMPEGTAIDLRASGVGTDDYFYVPTKHDNSEGIIIMFAPEGRVSEVTFSRLPNNATPFDESVTDNLFLLVGRRENAPPPVVAKDPTLDSMELNGKTEQQLQEMKEAVNWLRGESRWIVIGSQSGRVVTTENAFVNPQTIITKYAPPLIEQSEELRNEQIKASREFAREMVQVGGR